MTTCWNRPIIEAEMVHMIDLIGQIPEQSQIEHENIFTGSGPHQGTQTMRLDHL